MSILPIVIIASITLLAAARSGSSIPASSTRGVICHANPQRSLHQPQALSAPPFRVNRVPVTVGFFLVLGDDHEAHRFVRLEIRTAVQADEGLAEDGELDGQLIAFLAARIIGRRVMSRPDAAVGEGRGIKFRRLAGLSMVEPQAGGHLVVGHSLSPQLLSPETRPNDAPCGSTPSSTRSPVGTSIGPNRT